MTSIWNIVKALCLLPKDLYTWSSTKVRTFCCFAAADHPYVLLGTTVLAALAVWVMQLDLYSGYEGFLPETVEFAMITICGAFAIVSCIALVDKLRLKRRYRAQSIFCKPAARELSKFASWLIGAILVIALADRVDVLLQKIADITQAKSNPEPFFDSMVYMFYKSRALFLTGLWTTLKLALWGTLLGFLLAVLLVFMRIQEPTKRDRDFIKFVKYSASRFALLYTTVIRGTPMMLQACIIYYAGFGFFTANTDLSITEINKIWSFFISGLTTVSLNSAAYLTEVLRGGVESIDVGQTEAARSLGMTAWQTMMKVVFPQALKNSLPAIGNEMIINIKDSSVLNIIGVVELMYAAGSVAGVYYKYLPNYVAVAMIYLFLTCCISAMLGVLSRRLSLNTYEGIPSSN